MSIHLKNIEFILNEAARFVQMPFEQLKTLSFEDTFSSIPHPSGNGMLICGREAIDKLYESVETAIEGDRSTGKLDPEDVAQKLKQIIVDRFISEKRELTKVTADRAVSSAVRRSKKSSMTATFLVPCHLFEGGNTERFEIGPVVFEKSKKYIDEHAKGFDELVAEQQKRSVPHSEFTERLVNESLDYYKSFNWIAAVSLENTNTKMGQLHSEKIVQSALDCFHLILGTKYSHRMRVGGPNASLDRRAKIALDEAGKPHITTSGTHHDHHMPDDWWKHLLKSEDAETIQLMGIAISEAYKYFDQSALSRRFLEAAAWYGEAARDKFTASRLIKFVTAIERIVTTKNEKDLTDTISKRGAALICTRYDVKYEKAKKDIKEVYDARSRLVHGQVSPFDKKTTAALIDAERLSRAIAMTAIRFYGESGLTEKGVSVDRIDKEYDKVVKTVESRLVAASS